MTAPARPAEGFCHRCGHPSYFFVGGGAVHVVTVMPADPADYETHGDVCLCGCPHATVGRLARLDELDAWYRGVVP